MCYTQTKQGTIPSVILQSDVCSRYRAGCIIVILAEAESGKWSALRFGADDSRAKHASTGGVHSTNDYLWHYIDCSLCVRVVIYEGRNNNYRV